MNSTFGIPSYVINTASLGVYVEYPIFRSYCGNMLFDLTISYDLHRQNPIIFGRNWNFSYTSTIHKLNDSVSLIKSSGGTLTFSLKKDNKIQYDGYNEIVAPTSCRDRLFDYGTYYLYYEHNTKLYYTYEPLSHEDTHYLTTIFDASKNSIGLFYNNDMTLHKIIDCVSRETNFEYNDKQLCVKILLTDGRETNFEYNATHRLAKIYNFEGIPSTYTYDLEGNIKQITIGNKEKTIQFIYTTQGIHKQLTSVTDMNGITTSYAVASKSPVTINLLEANGTRSSYISEQGKTIRVVDVYGNTVEYEYNDFGISKIKNKANQITRYEYDTYGNLVTIMDSCGSVRSFTYDTMGNQLTCVEANGALYSYEYDTQNNLITIVSPLGYTTRLSYTDKGGISEILYPSGKIIRCHYDEFLNLTSIKDDIGLIMGATYDAFGYNQVESQYGNGYKNQFDFDQLNRLRFIKFPDGSFKSHEYDCCAGVHTKDQMGNLMLFERDAMSNITKKIDKLGHITGYQYDTQGNLVKEKDSLGRMTSYEYDSLNRLIKIEHPDQTLLQYGYDTADNPILFIDEHGNQTYSQYNCLNLESETIEASNSSYSYGYDVEGKLISITYPDNTNKQFIYDIEGKLINMLVNDAVEVALEYDYMGNATHIHDIIGLMNMSYDLRNRISCIIYYDGLTSNFIYDNHNNIISITYPNGIKTVYTHNFMQLITSIHFATLQCELTYDSLGRVIHIKRPNEVSSFFSYNKNSQVTMIQHQKNDEVIVIITFTYDEIGNVIEQAETIPSLDSLASIKEPSKNESITFEYNSQNQVISDSNQTTYTYDLKGNLIQIKGNRHVSIEYNTDNMPIRLELGNRICEHRYNSQKMLVSSVINNQQRYYYYDVNGRLLMESSDDQSLLNTYIYNGDQLFAMVDVYNELYYYHFDHRGNTVAITNSLGNVVNAYTYSAYGRILQRLEGIQNNFTFMGAFGVRDEGDNIYLTQHRYYDATLGRFIQKDPLGLEGSHNLYAYVDGNPMNKIDPQGLFGILAGFIILTGIGLAYKSYKAVTFVAKDLPDIAKKADDFSKSTQDLMSDYHKLERGDYSVDLQKSYQKTGKAYKNAWNKAGRVSIKAQGDFALPGSNSPGVDLTIDIAQDLCTPPD